ncbi:hypothetical protein Avbf_03427, partial [Armadillidium vulgare]
DCLNILKKQKFDIKLQYVAGVGVYYIQKLLTQHGSANKAVALYKDLSNWKMSSTYISNLLHIMVSYRGQRRYNTLHCSRKSYPIINFNIVLLSVYK